MEGDAAFLTRGGGGGLFGHGLGHSGEDILFEDRLVVRLVGMAREGGNPQVDGRESCVHLQHDRRRV